MKRKRPTEEYTDDTQSNLHSANIGAFRFSNESLIANLTKAVLDKDNDMVLHLSQYLAKNSNMQLYSFIGGIALNACATGNLFAVKCFSIFWDIANYANENGVKLCHAAAYHGQTDILKYFHDNGSEINTLNPFNNCNTFHYAVLGNQINILDYLIDVGADIDLSATPLALKAVHFAAYTGKYAMLNHMKIRGVSLTVVDSKNENALHYAINAEEISTIEYLINEGLVASNNSTYSTLEYAAISGKIKVIDYFISNWGIKADAPDEYGMSITHHALRAGQTELVKHLVSKRINIFSESFKNNNLAIQLAVKSGNVETVEYLERLGFDIGASAEGHNALDYDCSQKMKDYLIGKGIYYSRLHSVPKSLNYIPEAESPTTTEYELAPYLCSPNAKYNSSTWEQKPSLFCDNEILPHYIGGEMQSFEEFEYHPSSNLIGNVIVF